MASTTLSGSLSNILGIDRVSDTINGRLADRINISDFVTRSPINSTVYSNIYTDIENPFTHSINNQYTDSITSAFSSYATRSSINFVCDYPIYDGYLLFPQGVRIELLNKPSDDFLKEISLLHKAEWKDRT